MDSLSIYTWEVDRMEVPTYTCSHAPHRVYIKPQIVSILLLISVSV